MSAGGWFKSYRSRRDDDLFASEEFCPRAAWQDILCHAEYERSTATVGRKSVVLLADEFLGSKRYFASRWGWPDARVARFFARLEKAGRIELVRVDVCRIYRLSEDWRVSSDTPQKGDFGRPGNRPGNRPGKTGGSRPILKVVKAASLLASSDLSVDIWSDSDPVSDPVTDPVTDPTEEDKNIRTGRGAAPTRALAHFDFDQVRSEFAKQGHPDLARSCFDWYSARAWRRSGGQTVVDLSGCVAGWISRQRPLPAVSGGDIGAMSRPQSVDHADLICNSCRSHKHSQHCADTCGDRT